MDNLLIILIGLTGLIGLLVLSCALAEIFGWE